MALPADIVTTVGGRAVVDTVRGPPPRLRGWLPAAMAPLALLALVLLLSLPPRDPSTTGSAAFAAAMFVNFTASAALHRGRWTPQALQRLTRLDHATIFLVIAGAYTPVAALLVCGQDQAVLLVVVWTGAVAGALAVLIGNGGHRRIRVAGCVALGSLPIGFLLDAVSRATADVLVLLCAAGLLYLAGAVVYATRRPNPLPAWFGFHEVFHALVVLGYVAQSTALAIAAQSAPPPGAG